MNAILLPGYNGAANQPILVKLEKRLVGWSCERHELKRGRPSEGLSREMGELSQWARADSVLIGRSFGGRVCARYAALHGAKAVVLLGFPLRPPGKKRPDDEAALAALKCPTLIVQGDDDELGPLKIFRPLVRANPRLSLHVVKGAGHSFGRHEAKALDEVARWVEIL